MKNTFKTISSALFICLLSFSLVVGQEKKSEQKIKVVVIDDSGKKTEMDTLVKNCDKIDSVVMKDGKVIHLTDLKGSDVNHERKEKVTITVSTDGKDMRKTIKCVDKDENCKGENIIVASNDKCFEKEGSQSFRYRIKSDNKEPEGEKTKYVIKRDGMVISVEGDDYNKVKELVKEIESKLDSKSNTTEKGVAPKEDTKKTAGKR